MATGCPLTGGIDGSRNDTLGTSSLYQSVRLSPYTRDLWM